MPCYRVTVIVANVKQYRKFFYSQLRDVLGPYRIQLTVLYSDPDPVEHKKADSIDLSPPLGKKIPRFFIWNNRVLLQMLALKDVAKSDLIIIVQSTGYLVNYPLLLLSALGLKRIAFWGHGYNRQGRSGALSERVKRRLANASDWWFAYTQETARYLCSVGVSPHKITVIENAIDTRGVQETVESVTADEIASMRQRVGLTATDRVGLYCGSLYKEKRISLLLSSAAQIAKTVPDFRLLVVGAGLEAEAVQTFSKANLSVHYAGAMFGRDKAICFRIAELFFNPGAVGLGILDSFAASLPLVTTNDALHGPEIEYLRHGTNGLRVEGTSVALSQGVINLLQNDALLNKLRIGAAETAKRYTLENMVKNVRDGILACLLASSKRVRTDRTG